MGVSYEWCDIYLGPLEVSGKLFFSFSDQVFCNETFMSHWLTKNNENCSHDRRDACPTDSCPTMSGDFINQWDRRLACQRGIFG